MSAWASLLMKVFGVGRVQRPITTEANDAMTAAIRQRLESAVEEQVKAAENLRVAGEEVRGAAIAAIRHIENRGHR
ncbi:hypothetical protein J2X65_003471 [Ancylobacter sp. 3268]|uniref:hypothetical protein n=1 Tax=Ancylobacter sp. 3268 TaxID=2817752 RepID=UPI002859BD20|nr:hypothetical protein [Ancylobacter sp. 3268]MDR6954103.1 hypothetical protein [Ancylobacter sp. 3268]